MAWAAHEGSNSAVSTEGTTAGAGGLVNLDVLDDHLVGVESLGQSVGLSVLQKRKHGNDGLAGPATLSETPLLSLGCAANLAAVAAEGNATGLSQDLAVVLLGLAELHATDGVRGLEGILEVATKIVDLGMCCLCGDLRLSGVVHHLASTDIKHEK